MPLVFLGLALLALFLLEATLAPLGKWSAEAHGGLSGDAAASKSTDVAVGGRSEDARERNRCEHCGIVESTQRIAPVGNGPAMYEVTVRLSDRSKRVFSDPHAPRWRPGERIVLIEGGRTPQQ